MLKKKQFEGYKSDKYGFAIGDKVRLKKMFCRNGSRIFTITGRHTEDKRNSYMLTEAYSLIDNKGMPPRESNKKEYFNKGHLTKIN